MLCSILVAFMFAGTSIDQAQEQERPGAPQRQERPVQSQRPERQDQQDHAADWATDNLDLVSASPTQIREVLAKDPGLMVELKRLMAKQAIERGQIVAEQDLADDAILDRLATDTRFRALATRLLQRYGYLTPQLNPLSPSAKEQDLLLRAKADRLARASTTTDTDLRPESETPEATCEPGGGQSRLPGSKRVAPPHAGSRNRSHPKPPADPAKTTFPALSRHPDPHPPPPILTFRYLLGPGHPSPKISNLIWRAPP